MDRPVRRKTIKRSGRFVPCAPELAYCSDCNQNRQLGHCPRQHQPRSGGKDIAEQNTGTAKKKVEH